MIRPTGVVSKKAMGARRMTSRSSSNIYFDALSPAKLKRRPLTMVAKMALWKEQHNYD
jgi:hypothetical protein